MLVCFLLFLNSAIPTDYLKHVPKLCLINIHCGFTYFHPLAACSVEIYGCKKLNPTILK